MHLLLYLAVEKVLHGGYCVHGRHLVLHGLLCCWVWNVLVLHSLNLQASKQANLAITAPSGMDICNHQGMHTCTCTVQTEIDCLIHTWLPTDAHTVHHACCSRDTHIRTVCRTTHQENTNLLIPRLILCGPTSFLTSICVYTCSKTIIPYARMRRLILEQNHILKLGFGVHVSLDY